MDFGTDILIALGKVVLIVVMVLNLIPLLIWMERKGAAYIQDRRGPNRCHILGIRLGGIIHSLADAVKLVTKGSTSTSATFHPLFVIAPMISLFVACVTVAVIPFTEPLVIGDFTFQFQIADLSAGLLYVIALSSLSVYAILLAGWSSGGKFSLLGALRGSSQMISYELAMGLAIVAIFLVSGSFRLNDIVAEQGAIPWHWNAVRLPLSFILLFTAMFAETNRLPFDLPEGESELSAGYHTEYSAMRFGAFFMAEYAHLVVGSLIVTLLFFGGWHIPFLSSATLHAHASDVLRILWIIGGIKALLLGAFLVRHFVRRKGYWGDLRDYEFLVFGVPLLLVGLALAVGFFVVGPVVLPEWASRLLVFLLQLGVMLAKTLFFVWVFIWVRWTLPRFRYDQLMRLGWKVMIPLGLVNIFIAGMMTMYLER
ncbi:MAG: NADH-quinone oxidoreductase subunit H [Deltaproteobacteria bacterium]|nr:NADH-quinone oxidoreductase subunit H [Deltaproteobacteria bacterium]